MSYELKIKTGTIPQFKVVREAALKYQTSETAVTGPTAAYDICKGVIGDLDREHVVVLYLNQRHKVLGYEVVSIGTASQCFMSPKEVFRGALIHGAQAIVIAHNHPSGDPTPSQDDINVTNNIINAGKLLDIRVLDHIVIGDDRHVSIREKVPTFDWA